ncbi:PriCT-2 domain-containing protein [Listeria sp. ILCC792]|uniref:PriCT-2 domain-containing protein n=1 Tax=Listeria sp. ILCC792 TaxID=1918331 RepID=UPI0021018EAD|nr:PriCT-2 domain-containing protein [Listeria sp. ILCC792]
MENKIDLIEILKHIDPSMLDYTEWVNVGMALKEEGYTASDWDDWSKSDARYKNGEVFKKWESFQGNSSPVKGGTIVQLAKDQGFSFGDFNEVHSHELDWNDTIQDELIVVDRNWIEKREIEEPSVWNPVHEITTYFKTLFESNEKVGYVTDSWQNEEGKYLPSAGNYDRTARQLIDELERCNGDIGAVLGDYKEEAGA